MLKRAKLGTNILDLTPYLGKAKNRINRIGIELEGAWKALPPGTKLDPDGSVRPYANNKEQQDHPYRGELTSAALVPIEFNGWMIKNYPTLVNNTCGLHVHMSFEDVRFYALLMGDGKTPEYQDTMAYYLGLWGQKENLNNDHPIWDRLKGKKEYCRLDKFWPDLQVSQKGKNHDMHEDGNRYTGINYCFGLHGTLECRILPMFSNPEQGVRGVKTVMDITNACLVYLKTRDKEQNLDITVGPKDNYVEECKILI